MEGDALQALRAAISEGSSIDLLAGDDIVPLSDAKLLGLSVRGKTLKFDLDAETTFESQEPHHEFISLRTVVNCWLTRDLSVADYIERSDELGVKNLKFLERTALIEWLDGSNDECEYIKTSDGDHFATKDAKDEQLKDYLLHERSLLDHNTVLRGSKKINFSNAALQCHRQIISEYQKHQKPEGTKSAGGNSSYSTKSTSSLPPLKPGRNKDPIILLSPSPSSLLNMGNVKEFLEESKFEPALKGSTDAAFQRISRQSPLIGKVRFVVTDSVTQFKPEYWDRVVAVFVTGQPWQLRQYKWSDANTLFHNVLGFALLYRGDPVPELLKQWNVKIENLDRTKRFRDREVVERFWEQIEAYMVARGWPVAH